MKSLKVLLLLPLVIFIANSKTNAQDLSYTADYIQFNALNYCIKRGNITNGKSCTLTEGGYEITIQCSSKLETHTSFLYCASEGTMTVTSNAPLKSFSSRNVQKVSSDTYKTKSGEGLSRYSLDSNIYVLTINYYDHTYPSILDIRILGGNHNVLVDFLTSTKNTLKLTYTFTLDNTQEFQGEIAASHQGHLDRYLQSLNDCISVIDDRKEFTILDWRVQECSRRVVVFGMVLSELLNDYDHVERLQRYINTIRGTTAAVRKAYGWDRGIAGNASKATAALLEVVKLEIREIASIKIAAGFSNIELYTSILSTVNSLISKINASKSGDLIAQREIWGLVDKWNSSNWQTELDRLISAPVDQKQLILPKLQLMLMAIESLADLTRANFAIPVID